MNESFEFLRRITKSDMMHEARQTTSDVNRSLIVDLELLWRAATFRWSFLLH